VCLTAGAVWWKDSRNNQLVRYDEVPDKEKKFLIKMTTGGHAVKGSIGGLEGGESLHSAEQM